MQQQVIYEAEAWVNHYPHIHVYTAKSEISEEDAIEKVKRITREWEKGKEPDRVFCNTRYEEVLADLPKGSEYVADGHMIEGVHNSYKPAFGGWDLH